MSNDTLRRATAPRLRPTLLSLLSFLMLAVAACSSDPKPGTPEAAAEGERIMRHMSDALAGMRTFRFTTAESIEQVASPTGRRVLRFTRTVTVRRPDALFFEAHGIPPTKADVAAYYDGRMVSLRDNRSGVWAQTAAPATIDAMLDDVARRYAVPVPIGDVVYSVPYDAFIGRSTKGGFVGRETIDGVECAHLKYTDEYIEVELWVPDSDPPLPRRVKLIYKLARGAPSALLDFTSWDLAPQIAKGTFAFQPSAASEQISFNQLTTRLFADGQSASAAPPSFDRIRRRAAELKDSIKVM